MVISSMMNIQKLTSMTTTASGTKTPTPKPISNEEKRINLNALKNHDPFATNILAQAQRVAVYKFLSKKNEWKKLDVEGSLFLFERMVEPLHSFVVMNTLALNLFLQPITSDLEFQDRNPFLLYKSNNDIFGIWFIDKDDCERIKSLIMNLSQEARERREKREKSRQQQQTPQLTPTAPNLITPLTLLSDLTSPSSSVATHSPQNIDIVQLLNKAQLEYTASNGVPVSQLALSPASHSTPATSGLISSSTEAPKQLLSQLLFVNSNPNPSASGASSSSGSSSRPAAESSSANNIMMMLNASSSLSSTSSPTSSSTSSSTNDTAKKQSMNPIVQMLFENSSSASKPIDSGASQNQKKENKDQEKLSQELKRQLNIQPLKSAPAMASTSSSTTTTPTASASTSMLNSLLLKRPITVQDFEENLLNSSNATPTPFAAAPTSHRPFQEVDLDADDDEDDDSTDSSDTSSSSMSSSSDDHWSQALESDGMVASAATSAPLLLTPAAFESSSASSTASSSFQPQPSTGANDCQLFPPTQFSFDPSHLNSYTASDSQQPLLNKEQFKNVLINLLTTDDQFVGAIHDAYLKSNKSKPQKPAAQPPVASSSQPSKPANSNKHHHGKQQAAKPHKSNSATNNQCETGVSSNPQPNMPRSNTTSNFSKSSNQTHSRKQQQQPPLSYANIVNHGQKK